MSARAFEIVVLSSSPPNHPEYDMPSSPPHAIPEPSIRRAPIPEPRPQSLSPQLSPQNQVSGASRTVSRKAAIPPDAIRGFTTVSSLVRSEHFPPQDNDNVPHTGKPNSRIKSLGASEGTKQTTKKPGKLVTEAAESESSTKPKPKPRIQKPKTGKNAALHDPELRNPPQKVSPYFTTDEPTISGAPLVQPQDAAPKLTKAGKPRKPRAKKDKTAGEVSEPKARGTKAARSKAPKSAKTEQEAGIVQSVHFSKGANDVVDTNMAGAVAVSTIAGDFTETTSIWDMPENPNQNPKETRAVKQEHANSLSNCLDLDAAVARRRDWTPPRDTTIASSFADSAGKENKKKDLAGDSNDQFSNLISNFAYTHVSPSRITSATEKRPLEPVVTKRRRIELIDLPGNQSNSRNSSPEKGKAPKKKARTITDRATERYLPQEPQSEPVEAGHDFFEPRTGTTKVPLNDTAAETAEGGSKKISRRRNTKAAAESSGAAAKSKRAFSKASAKPKKVAEKLLSPASAMTRMGRQEMLFGTSSQLAMEESPTTVRQIQQAIKESEADSNSSFDALLGPPPCWPRLGKVRGSRKLWNASWRDSEGGLLEPKEDLYLPEFDRTQDYPLFMDGMNDGYSAHQTKSEEPDDMQQPPRAAIIISSDPPTPPVSTSKIVGPLLSVDHNLQDDVSVFEDIDNFDFLPPPSNQKVESQDSFADIDDFDLPPSAQLRSNILSSATNAVSPNGRRGHSQKTRSAIPFSASKPRPAKATATIPKLQKSASAPPLTPSRLSQRFVDIEEILDSEDEMHAALSPTPPRTRKLQPSEPLPLFKPSHRTPGKEKLRSDAGVASTVSVHKIPTEYLSWNGIKSQIFPAITAHIRSLVPSNDPRNPTWHEKMLMYDPIVLEDFTAHLNTATSIRTYKRATQKQVKAWNKEAKSAGREELGVVEREEKVLAVEKELECYQVRDWCEGLSICCIWGEGRGRGGAMKGYF